MYSSVSYSVPLPLWRRCVVYLCTHPQCPDPPGVVVPGGVGDGVVCAIAGGLVGAGAPVCCGTACSAAAVDASHVGRLVEVFVLHATPIVGADGECGWRDCRSTK